VTGGPRSRTESGATKPAVIRFKPQRRRKMNPKTTYALGVRSLLPHLDAGCRGRGATRPDLMRTSSHRGAQIQCSAMSWLHGSNRVARLRKGPGPVQADPVRDPNRLKSIKFIGL
jgi:hypothetical protein